MKLSRTGWNNVIIFSVMIIILLINATNDRLFPEGESANDKTLLPEHSVILTLAINFSDSRQLTFERVGRAWKMTSQGILVDLSNQQIEQLMLAWQQSSGLVQADDILVEGLTGIEVLINTATSKQELAYMLYPLVDQLLVFNLQKKLWLALPKAVAHQLVPNQ
ncbi:MAG: hypothetical protein QNK36_09055 [Colwellia sp.]|nr:hypothetical protein [Colwellia sp.]